MTKNTKTILGVVAVVGIGYWLYKKNWLKNPFSNFNANEDAFKHFTTDDNFLNLTQEGCQTFSGNVGYVGMAITSYGTNGGIIVSTGNGQTVVCPKGQRYVMPSTKV